MFDQDRFIEACRLAVRETDARAAVMELVREAVADPAAVVRGLGEPTRAGVQTLYRGDDLTVLNLMWGPGMDFQPHDHRMWAVIGIYGGQEDNSFFRRQGAGLARYGVRPLRTGDVAPLGADVIHAVRNPLDRITAAIHVYGGDFFGTPRSEWDPVSHVERPYDVEGTLRAFEASNRALEARGG